MSDNEALVAACQVILSAKLPPNAPAIWVERQKIAADLIKAMAEYGALQSKLPAAQTLQSQENMRQEMHALSAKCNYLGDRLLQIAAAAAVPDILQ